MKNQKAITLVALIITVIVLLILAMVSIRLVMNGGILDKAKYAVDKNFEAELREKVNLAYNEWNMKKYSGENAELKDVVELRLNESYGDNNVEVSALGKSVTSKVAKNGIDYEYTLMPDGSIEQGKFAYLDIADGNIDLYENGYKQYTGNLQGLNKKDATAYTGKYIITGKTTENVVRVCDVGTYDITINNLNIDFSDSSTSKSPFSANAGEKLTECFVNLTIEGKSFLKGKNKPGLLAGGGEPNVDGVINGSTLTIQGNGSLKTIGNGPAYDGAGIGGQPNPSGQVCNIIINSGNITSECTGHGAGIRWRFISEC